jgi:hypothetical protein
MNIEQEIEKLNKRLDTHTDLFLDIQYALTHQEKYSQSIENVISGLIEKELRLKK